MRCQICNYPELIHDTRDMQYSYKGESTTIPAVVGDFCPACKESILSASESRRTMELMMAFNKQTDSHVK